MHFFLKGIAGKMIVLTFDASYAAKEFNIFHPLNAVSLMNARRCMLSSSPPDRQEWPKAVFDTPAQLKCAEILSFVRLYAIPCLIGLPNDAYAVWLIFCRLASKLLFEGEVSMLWIESETGARKEISDFLTKFQVPPRFFCALSNADCVMR